MKFRKKSVVIDAVRFTGKMTPELDAFLCDNAEYYPEGIAGPYLLIETLEGTMRANSGDWIIRGVKGEFYPCKNDIFLETYEEVK